MPSNFVSFSVKAVGSRAAIRSVKTVGLVGHSIWFHSTSISNSNEIC